ncbi:MAG: hypothetical protein WAM92_21445 [Mycobacterium sp.]
MHADTDAIRLYGGATADLAAEMRAAAAGLSPDLGLTIADALGPVGTRFARALTCAMESLASSVTRIREDIAAHATTTAAAAARFDDVESSAQERISRVMS